MTFCLLFEKSSGRADSNRRSLDPQSSALTNLGHVPLRRSIVPAAHARRVLAGPVSLAQPRRLPKRSPATRRAAAVRDYRRGGKLRCAGHGGGAVVVVVAIAASSHSHRRGWAVEGTRSSPPSLLRRRLRGRGADEPGADAGPPDQEA